MPFIPVTLEGGPNPVTIVIGFIDFIASLFGFHRDDTKALQQAINSTWANLAINAAFLYNAVGFLTEFIKKFLGILLGGLVHILSDIIHGRLKQLLQDIRDLLHHLHDLFAPLLAWLRRLQVIQRQQQMLALKRIVNLIQRVRQVLLPFRLLHLKFASKLDAWLSGVEGKIITRELAIAGKTNEIIGWVNTILDPFGFWRFNHAGRSLGQFADSLFRIFTGRGFDYWYTRGHPPPLTRANTIPIAQHFAALRADLAAGSGDVPAWREDFATQLTVWRAQS